MGEGHFGGKHLALNPDHMAILDIPSVIFCFINVPAKLQALFGCRSFSRLTIYFFIICLSQILFVIFLVNK